MSVKGLHKGIFFTWKETGTGMMEVKEEGHYNRIYPFPLFSQLFDD